MTPEIATDIFIEHYFERPRIAALPEVLQPSVFDMYVNAGSNAVRILQRLLRRMGHDIAVDGIIGPHTIRAAHSAAEGRARSPRRRLRHRAAELLLPPRRPPPRQPEIRPPPRWREGRLDRPGGDLHRTALPPQRSAASRKGCGMGLIGRALSLGAIASVGEAAEDLSEVFVANATREMELSQEAYAMALEAAAEEYRHAGTAVFDRFVNGLNRLPRPLMALGTIGLFVFAMVDPVGLRGAHGGAGGGAGAALVASGRDRRLLFRRAGVALPPRAARGVEQAWAPLAGPLGPAATKGAEDWDAEIPALVDWARAAQSRRPRPLPKTRASRLCRLTLPLPGLRFGITPIGTNDVQSGACAASALNAKQVMGDR
jgi:hypothetical protein